MRSIAPWRYTIFSHSLAPMCRRPELPSFSRARIETTHPAPRLSCARKSTGARLHESGWCSRGGNRWQGAEIHVPGLGLNCSWDGGTAVFFFFLATTTSRTTETQKKKRQRQPDPRTEPPRAAAVTPFFHLDDLHTWLRHVSAELASSWWRLRKEYSPQGISPVSLVFSPVFSPVSPVFSLEFFRDSCFSCGALAGNILSEFLPWPPFGRIWRSGNIPSNFFFRDLSCGCVFALKMRSCEIPWFFSCKISCGNVCVSCKISCGTLPSVAGLWAM